MKTVAIHQPHYMPWLGYLDKMQKADEFVVMDDVQLTDRSPMRRNKFLQLGKGESYLSLNIEKKGYREKRTRDIHLSDWRENRRNHLRFLELNYKKTAGYEEVMPLVTRYLEQDFNYLIEVDLATMELLREIYGISTPLVMQSSLDYDHNAKNNDLILSLCLASKANRYLSGRGARSYMNVEGFRARGIDVAFQVFSYPVYEQYKQDEFISNLSGIDMAMQLGIEAAQTLFMRNAVEEDWHE